MASSQTLAASAIQNLLFEVHPQLQDALHIRSGMRQVIGGIKKAPVSGKYYRVDSITGGNFRLEGRPEDGVLPGYDAANFPGDVKSPLATLQLQHKRRYAYTSIDYTGPMENAPRTSEGGYAKIRAIVMKQTLEAWPEMFSKKMAMGQGTVLGQIASVSTTTLTLEAANNPATASVAYPWAGNRLFRVGQVLDAINGSTMTNALRNSAAADRGRRVTAVSREGTAPTITIHAAASTWAAGDLITEFNTRDTSAIAASASDYETKWYNPQGLMDAIQSGSDGLYSLAFYGGQQVSSFPMLQSFQINNATVTAFSLDMANRGLSLMRTDGLGARDVDCLLSTPDVFRKFQATANFVNFGTNAAQTNLQRFNNPGKEFNPTVGVKGIDVQNIGSEGSKMWYTDEFAPHYRVFGIKKDLLMVLEDRPFGVLDDDGLEFRWTQGTDAFSVAWKWYCSGLINLKPSAHIYWTGIQGDYNN